MRASPRPLPPKAWVYPAHLEGRSVGLRTYQAHGCRCEGCYNAKLAYGAAYRVVNPPPPQPSTIGTAASVKTREAVECLIARGYSASECMAKLGISYETFVDVLDRMAA